MEKALLTKIQKFCLHDGPGIRTTIFFKGCPLKCLWCHNPETQNSQPEIFVQHTRCIGCGACRQVCLNGFLLSPESCVLCGACTQVCPTKARFISGFYLSTLEIMDIIKRDILFYENSSGGVTFSGGEPLQQTSVLLELLHECIKNNIHTAIDTCGFVNLESLVAVAKYTDLFLYDIKIYNSSEHEKWTGYPNEKILSNLIELDKIHKNIWIRIPIIPELNGMLTEMELISIFIKNLNHIKQVNLLPYHQTWLYKTEALRKSIGEKRFSPPRTEQLFPLLEPFHNIGIKAVVGG